MTGLYLVAGIVFMITMAIALARAFVGPTVFDRILAVNMFGTKAVLLVALIAFFSGREDLLDIALLYSLLNFIGVVAALRLVERGRFYASPDDEDTDEDVTPAPATSGSAQAVRKEDHPS